MKNKNFYPIYKLKIKSWIKYWLIKQTEFKGVLSDILEGISFYLTDSLNMKFKMFKIYGRTIQDGNPTPENPIPIKNTGDNGSVNEKVQNRNLFDINTAEKNVWLGQNNNRLVIQNAIVTDYIRVNSNKSYTFSSINNYLSNRAYYTVNQFDKNHTWIKGQEFSLSVGNNLNATVNLESNCSFIKFSVRDITLNTNVQVEEGSTATSYVPHSEQNPSFPLVQGQKLMEGDYLADDGVHHVRGETILNGTESWKVKNTTDNNIHFSSNVLDSLGVPTAKLSDHFIKYSGSLWSNDVQGFGFVTDAYHLRIRIDKNLLNDISTSDKAIQSFKTWLNNNNTIIQYGLPQEVIDPFTEEQQQYYDEHIKPLRTYKNVTHISSEDETPALLKIQYWKEG